MRPFNCYKSGNCFRFSKINQRLFIASSSLKAISLDNLETKKVEISLNRPIRSFIVDFRVFGEQEDRVLAVTQFGHLILYKVDYVYKTAKIIAE